MIEVMTFSEAGGHLVNEDAFEILAMSDGVWKYVGWDRLSVAVRSPRDAPLAETLQRAARLPRSGQFPDDFTLVVFEDTV